MRTITVRDEFSALKDFTTNLPQTFEREGLVMQDSRNVIKRIDTSHGSLVVKNFTGMYFFNRLAYSLFRKSKAARSYIYSAILNEKGIRTPPHVAWMDCYSMGLLTRSYFVSVFYPYQTLNEIIQYYDIFEPSLKDGLFRELAMFIKKLHKKGIYHEDLSLGNILVIRTLNGYDFALVDLNRIKFRRIEGNDGLRNFTTLRMSPEDLNSLIAEYARLTDQVVEKAIDIFWKYERRSTFLRRLRRRIRYFTVDLFENFLRQGTRVLTVSICDPVLNF